MSRSRILGDGQRCFYHVLSRVIERRFIFDDQGQEYFKKVMRAQEAFSGVRVLTWTCMSNHFHMLVAVDDKESEEVRRELARLMEDDEAFLERLKHLYAPEAMDEVRERLALIRGGDGQSSAAAAKGDEGAGEGGGEAGAFVVLDAQEAAQCRARDIAQFKQPYLDRMFALSAFVGEIKQRISLWYNGRNERLGPVWEDRFKSVLVQGEPGYWRSWLPTLI